MSARASKKAQTWLIVGHGSVGSSVAKRLDAHGDIVGVYDPSPRIPVMAGSHLEAITPDHGVVDWIISCVPPHAAESVPQLVAPAIGRRTVFQDWNAISPGSKRQIGGLLPCDVVDVALLDSIDGNVAKPNIAVSGARTSLVKRVFDERDFDCRIAGAELGQAALLKCARSMFMKSLEGLALEYFALAAEIDDEDIVFNSIATNLGREFTDFLELLLTTNRLHAARRANELAMALAVFRELGYEPRVAEGAVRTLARAVEAWEEKDAPAEYADPDELIAHLRRRLWAFDSTTPIL